MQLKQPHSVLVEEPRVLKQKPWECPPHTEVEAFGSRRARWVSSMVQMTWESIVVSSRIN